MANSKPTIVLVHGLWHVPASYSKLTDSLRSSGHEVHVPRLPSMNEMRPPNADLVTDTELVRGYVESLVNAGRNVIAIMHSYGGVVGTNALCGLSLKDRTQKGLSGGVSHLIYLCAFALPDGGSMVGKVKEFGHEELLPLAFDFAEDESCVVRDPKTVLIGADVEDPGVEGYLASLVRCNGKSMYQPITQCAWRENPVSYIFTSLDMTVPLDYQKSMVEKMKAEGAQVVHTVELITGHCPNLTMTDEVVAFLVQVLLGQTID